MSRVHFNGVRVARILGTTYVSAVDIAALLEDVAGSVADKAGVEQRNMLKIAEGLRAAAGAPIGERGAGGLN